VERVGAADDPLRSWHEALAELDGIVTGDGSTRTALRTALTVFSDSDLAKMHERLDSAAVMS
jgi:hypothetical protein